MDCDEREDLLTMSTTINRLDRPESITILRDSNVLQFDDIRAGIPFTEMMTVEKDLPDILSPKLPPVHRTV